MSSEQTPTDFWSLPVEERYGGVRAASEALCEPLSPEDCAVQSMEDASPAKWHLAHTSWFFETFVLDRAVAGYRSFDPSYRVLFNSYYNSVGEQYARPRRGLLTRPGFDEVLAYRRHVDRHLLDVLAKGSDLPAEVQDIIELGLHHEQQHQELLLTDVKHMLSFNPLRPAYRESSLRSGSTSDGPPLTWLARDEGLRWIGHDGVGFAFDNEGPRHRAFVDAYELASRPVTNGEFLDFVNDGGYEAPGIWLSDGWATRCERGWKSPLYWEEREGEWFAQTLGGLEQVRRGEAVCHVSFYEADAYARWAGARLPTEAEWEGPALDAPIRGNFVENGRLHPDAARQHGDGPSQMFGDVWEWTASPYAPYPGFRTPEGAIGEYNGKFMCNQMVLRGGSCATPESHIRPTYRNFFYPDARWQFSGIRLARSAS